MQPRMFSSELQFISTTAKLFHLERFAIYNLGMKKDIASHTHEHMLYFIQGIIDKVTSWPQLISKLLVTPLNGLTLFTQGVFV